MDTGASAQTYGDQQYGAYAGMHTPDSSQGGLTTGQGHSPSLSSASPQPLLGTPQSPNVADNTPASPMVQHVQYVMQPDGTQQAVVIQSDGTQQPVIAQPGVMQQQQVIVQPDGTQVIIQPDGTQLVMQSAGMQEQQNLAQGQYIVQDQTGTQYIMGGEGQQFATGANLTQQHAVPQQEQQPPPYPADKLEAPPAAGAAQTIWSRPFFEQGKPTPKFWIALGVILIVALAVGLGVGLGTRKKDCYSPDSIYCYGYDKCSEIVDGCRAYYCC